MKKERDNNVFKKRKSIKLNDKEEELKKGCC